MSRRPTISARRRAQFKALIAEPATARLDGSAAPVHPYRKDGTDAAMQSVEARLRTLAGLVGAGLRHAQRMHAAHTSAKRMRVVETVALGEKRFAALLQVDGAQFLVGGGAASVSLLAMLPCTDVPAAGTAPAEAEHPGATMTQQAFGLATECAP